MSNHISKIEAPENKQEGNPEDTENKWAKVAEVEFGGEQAPPPETNPAEESPSHTTRANVLQAYDVRKPRAEKELTKQEAGDEYMKLLAELGADLDGRNMDKKVDSSYFRHIRKSEEGLPQSMSNVSRLIDAEIIWQSAGKKLEETNANLTKLDDERASQGFIKKLFSGGEYRRKKKQLTSEKSIAAVRSRKASVVIENTLNPSYEDTTSTRGQKADQRNEDLNARFFSDDRADKIQRAMELRTKYLNGDRLTANVGALEASIGRFD